jgi:hypothetical protein
MENKHEGPHDCPRQGDILFRPVKQVPVNPTEQNIVKDGVIAKGEVTGHHHRLENLKKAAVFMAGLAMYVRVFNKEGVNVVHEEHGTTHLPQGDFEVHHAQEHDYLENTVREVAD